MFRKFILAAVIGAMPLTAIAQTCGGGLPNNLTNGNNADAVQVMANFNYIANCYATLGANTFNGAQTLPGNPTSPLQAATKQYVDAAGGGGAGGGFINRLRNASMVAWTNGSSGSISIGAAGSAAIAASGWSAIASGAAITWSQLTAGFSGASQSLQLTGNSSVTDVKLAQRIESYDAALLAGTTATFQIAVYNNTGGSITPQLSTAYPTAPDNFTGGTTTDLAPTSLQACANASWCTLAYAFNVSSNATAGYQITVDFGNNFSTSSKYVRATAADLRPTPGVSVGLSSSPPLPEIPSVQAELGRSARYLQSNYQNGTTPGSSVTSSNDQYSMDGSLVLSGNHGAWSIKFPVRMRANPSVSFWDRAGSSGMMSAYSSGFSDGQNGLSGVIGSSQSGFMVGQGTNADNNTLFLLYAAYADFW